MLPEILVMHFTCINNIKRQTDGWIDRHLYLLQIQINGFTNNKISVGVNEITVGFSFLAVYLILMYLGALYG